MEELKCVWDPEFLSRPASSFLAAVAGQGVEGSCPHLRIVIFERVHESAEGVLVDEVVEKVDALASDDRHSMVKAVPHRRQTAWPRGEEVLLGPLSA